MRSKMIISQLSRIYTRYPVAANMLVYGGLYSAGDISQQSLLKHHKYDWVNTSRIGFVGASIFGPFYHFWYRYLDRIIPGNTGRIIVRKLFIDQAFAGILGVSLFYTATSILEGKENVLEDTIQKGPTTFLTGCIYWPLVQCANFACVPSPYRALYVAVAAFIWTNILCYQKMSCNNIIQDG